MSIKIQIEGLEELRKAFTNLDAQFGQAVDDALEDAILAIRTRVITAVQRGPKTGATYQKTKPKRTHRASAPGQPPATDTGTLVRSVYFELAPLTATVGSRLAYAAYLEYGTRRMAARPIWQIAAQEESARIGRRIEENLRKLMG